MVSFTWKSGLRKLILFSYHAVKAILVIHNQANFLNIQSHWSHSHSDSLRVIVFVLIGLSAIGISSCKLKINHLKHLTNESNNNNKK